MQDKASIKDYSEILPDNYNLAKPLTKFSEK